MAIATRTRLKLQGLLGKGPGTDVAEQIDSGGNPVADNVAALGTTSDLSASASEASVTTGGTPDCEAAAIETAIDAAVDAAVDALAAEVETRLDDIEAKVDAVIAAMVAAGQMASS